MLDQYLNMIQEGSQTSKVAFHPVYKKCNSGCKQLTKGGKYEVIFGPAGQTVSVRAALTGFCRAICTLKVLRIKSTQHPDKTQQYKIYISDQIKEVRIWNDKVLTKINKIKDPKKKEGFLKIYNSIKRM